MRWLDNITESMDMSLSKIREILQDGKLGVLQSMDHQELDVTQRLDSKQKFHTTILSGLYKHEI